MLFSNESITSSTSDSEYMTYNRGGKRFGVHIYSDDPLYPAFDVSEIHPYDNAEYAWARCGEQGAACVEFIQNGKVIDKMQWHTYDEEDYEYPDEYLDEMIDQTCIELSNLNEDVKSVMVHN